jgi:hypothetical protein
LVATVSCNRIKEVKVKVYDISNGQGIKGISVYYQDELFTTDEAGEVALSSRLNMNGNIVSTNISIPNFTNASYPTTCQIKNEY